MKQIFLPLLFLLCLFAGASRAATVSGTVTNAATSAVVPGQKVYINDSVSAGVLYRDSMFTNSSGFYSFTIPSTVTTGVCTVWSFGCGYFAYNQTFYSGSSLTLNISLCSYSAAHITDTFRNSTTGSLLAGQKVYLLDSTATFYYKDSVNTNSIGIANFLMPTSILSGTIKIYTFACGQQSQLVSYASNSIIAPTMYICSTNGSISGVLTNVTTSLPVANMKVYIVDSAGGAVSYRDSMYTNSTGSYTFNVPASVLPTGNMIVYTIACGSRVANNAPYTGSNLTLNLSVCSSSSVTISGIVTNNTTLLPVSGQKVYISDSTNSIIYRDSAFTNASGGYSFTIPPSITSGYISVYTYACSAWTYNGTNYNNVSATLSLGVCTPQPVYTFSGTIYNNLGAPLAGAAVWIYSSSAPSAVVATTTASNGSYSITIPNGSTYQTITWSDSVAGCAVHSWVYGFNGYNLTKSDSLCVPTTYTLQGYVYLGYASPVPNAKVYLIGEELDMTVTPPALLLKAYDSTISNSAAHFSFSSINTVRTNAQHLKAALQPANPSYLGVLPTYTDSALLWSSARTFGASDWMNNYTFNIHMRAGTNPGGPGFIGGDVLLGANKQTAVGDPLSQRILILTTSTGTAVAYTYSDAGGHFTFPNLAYGTYKIFGDAWGKSNPALTVTISAGHASVGNIVFEENNVKFEGHFKEANGVSATALEAVGIYPNPAQAYVAFSGLNNISGNKTVVLRDVTGAMISKTEIAAGSAGRINTNQLPAGMYMLQLQTAEGSANFKFVKE